MHRGQWHRKGMVMDALHNLLSRLKTSSVARDERGVTAIEYALIGVLVGITVMVGLTAVGANLTNKFTYFSTLVASLPGK